MVLATPFARHAPRAVKRQQGFGCVRRRPRAKRRRHARKVKVKAVDGDTSHQNRDGGTSPLPAPLTRLDARPDSVRRRLSGEAHVLAASERPTTPT